MKTPRPESAPRPLVVNIGGVGKSALRAALDERGVQLNEAAETLFADPRFATLASTRPLAIALVTVAELGFYDGATYGELIARAIAAGMLECPLEVGAHLRLVDVDQPESPVQTSPSRGRAPPGSITVASAPLDDTDETPKGFYLRRLGDVRWLRGYRSWPGHRWSPEDRFVFAVSPFVR